MTMRTITVILAAALSLTTVACGAAEHPRLLLTADDIREFGATWEDSPLLSSSIRAEQQRIDAYFAEAPDVPVPADAGGGYTHEQHKSNGRAIQDAGMLYQWTGEQRYAEYAESLLLEYAELFPTLGKHPRRKENHPHGRLFWQSLNEAVWLLQAVQGYDAVYDALAPGKRDRIEENLFRPLATFLSVESPGTFDRIHNHGTWATAAVGMTGMVLGDDRFVNMALYGTREDGEGGFLRQVDELFSPDGFYAEGPYYQRYALLPFVVFAKALDNNRPELGIFERRDGVLIKAIQTTLQLSYAGKFFPINDAIKDKGLDTGELAYGVTIAWSLTGDTSLLDVSEQNTQVVLTGDGARYARAIDAGRATPFIQDSRAITGGADGTEGGLAVLRAGDSRKHSAVVFKATPQGMGHGHFDRLNWLYYDNGNEIVRDYGAARFLNVVQKYGGHYLAENNSWAKQTIAHNALVVDETSHFEGNYKAGEEAAPEDLFFAVDDAVQLTSAVERHAYDGVTMRRTLATVASGAFDQPIVVDVLRVGSSQRHQYDLPLYFNGQIIDINVPVEARLARLEPLGDANGYQHLWQTAAAEPVADGAFAITWLLDNRFYTHKSVSSQPFQALFVQTGANDPDFNLRREQGLVFRVDDAAQQTFVGVLESHGEYNGAREFTVGSESRIKSVEHVGADGKDVVRVETKAGQVLTLALSYDRDPSAEHSVETPHGAVTWTGYFSLQQ